MMMQHLQMMTMAVSPGAPCLPVPAPQTTHPRTWPEPHRALSSRQLRRLQQRPLPLVCGRCTRRLKEHQQRSTLGLHHEPVSEVARSRHAIMWANI